MSKDYTVIDLFSGCGGFGQGFLKAGFKIMAANEFWDPAADTYEFNHKNTPLIRGDITLEETKQKVYDTVKEKNVNVIIGGPPCQAYSIAGNRNPDDPRGQLYLDFIEIIDTLKPDFFIMENVKGLLHMKHIDPKLSGDRLVIFKESCETFQRYKDLKRYGAQRDLDQEETEEFKEIKKKLKKIKKNIEVNLVPLIDKIIEKFESIGYKVTWKLLNSANYGVAQTRERIIFIGTKHRKIKLRFPRTTHEEERNQNSNSDNASNQEKKEKWINSREILERYENWEEDKEKSHLFTNHSKDFVVRLKNTPIGENLYKNYSDAWWRLDPERPSRTVKENHGGVFIHYKHDRVCTPRELAALQSFDDDFIFKGTKSSILKQIGNAIPPVMAKALAIQVKHLLDEIHLKSEIY